MPSSGYKCASSNKDYVEWVSKQWVCYCHEADEPQDEVTEAHSGNKEATRQRLHKPYNRHYH